MKRLRRILLVAIVTLCGAFSFLQWLAGRWRGTLRAELGDRFQDGLGWWSPAMAPHWDRVAVSGDTYHDLKNLGTEWTRSDAQRAFKFWAFWCVSGWCLALGLTVSIVAAILI